MTFYAGQRITISGGKFNGNGKVVKVLPKNVDIVLDGGREVRAHPSFLRPEGTDAPAPKVEPMILPPAIGTVVRFAGNDSRIHGLYAVTGEGFRRGTTVVKMARLGGDGGRYWTVAAKDVQVVPVEELAAQLASV